MDSEGTEQGGSVEPCWPFWGQLKVGTSHTHKKIDFEWAQNDYFQRFNLVRLWALRILERRDLDEIRFSAECIQKEIDDSVDAYIENETASLIKRLAEQGGYQCLYLPDGSNGTESEIRDLLENWSGDFDDPSGLPKRDDVSELDLLSEFLEYENVRNNPDIEFIQLGLCEAEPQEFYAVLALMTVCQAIHSNPHPKRINCYVVEPSKAAITAIGDATIQAVEIMAYGDKVKFEAQIKKAIAAQWPALLEAAVNERISERASKAAQKRHGKNDSARDFVSAEWKRTCAEYDGNKTAFTRDYVRRVLNEYDVQVTEKTMREVWLKDTPNAGKQAG